jgi:hypothetical protein
MRKKNKNKKKEKNKKKRIAQRFTINLHSETLNSFSFFLIERKKRNTCYLFSVSGKQNRLD